MVTIRVVCVALICAIVGAELPHPLSDNFINLINSKSKTWTAGRNFREDIPFNYIKNLMGTLKDDHQLEQLPKILAQSEVIAKLPKNFDARDKWPNCPTLKQIRDQGSCGSCWAVAAVGAMSDRVCIYSNGTQDFHFSAEDLLTCCKYCGLGCSGGYPIDAWRYWQEYGIVSGGDYETSQGCRPYEIEPCKHNICSQRRPCIDLAMTPECEESCEEDYNYDYDEDKRFGKTVYRSIGEDEIRAEIYQHGSVEANLTVYCDFIHYKTGIYRYVTGDEIGSHSVKIIGWGEENGIKYWLVANSWNTDWGDNGFFKIIRGINHCNIECCVVAGEPDLKRRGDFDKITI